MRWTTIMAATIAASAAAATTTHAQSIAGEWRLDEARSQSAREAVATARGGGGGGGMMSRGGEGGAGGTIMIRGAATGVIGLLRGTQRLRVELTDERATLQLDDSEPFSLPLDGDAATVSRWEQQVSARARVVDGVLTVETTLANGDVVTERYAPAAGGELEAVLEVPLPATRAGEPPVRVTIRRVYTPVS